MLDLNFFDLSSTIWIFGYSNKLCHVLSIGSKDRQQLPATMDPSKMTPQQAAELSQMMALGGYALDPNYLSYMYSGMLPGMSAMPMLQPGLSPGMKQ